MGKVITIDGPAASGKTTLSRLLAQRLGWKWVSTGAFYRGLAFVAQALQVSAQDEKALAELARSSKWQVVMAEDNTRVFLGEKDVTDQIFREEVGTLASQISQLPLVRLSLLAGQRLFKDAASGLIAEGRDCGTVVFPEAEVKVFVTASSENRAERRAREQGLPTELTQQIQAQRDHRDSSRKTAPLQVPADAYLLDTTHLTLDQALDQLERHVRAQLKI